MQDGLIKKNKGLKENGGLVISKFNQGELQPIAQGIKQDQAFALSTNDALLPENNLKPSPSSTTQTSTVNPNVTIDNSRVIAAINRLTEAMMSNSSKEITLAMDGQTVGKVLTPIMATPMTGEINNTSVAT